MGDLHLESYAATNDPYVLFDGSLDGNTTADAVAARVEREQRVTRVSLSFPSVPAGRVRAQSNPLPPLAGPFAGALVGDLVVLGPPADLPAGLLAFGLVTGPDTVEVRLFNGTAAAVHPPTRTWTVAYGRGANNVLPPP